MKLTNRKNQIQNNLWEDEELEDLLQLENTCVKMVTRKKQIPMHPHQLEEIDHNLTQLMNSLLYRHDQELGGWILAYRNIKIMSRFGYVFWDEAKQFHPRSIQIEIEGDFYVFQPEVGKQLIGVIKKVLAYQIEVEALKGFNVTLPKFFADTVEWIGNRLTEDQMIIFTIDHINSHTMCPYIHGFVKRNKADSECENSSPVENSDEIIDVFFGL